MSRALYAIPDSKGVYIAHQGTLDWFIGTIRNACEVHGQDVHLDESHVPALRVLQRVHGDGDGSDAYSKIIDLIKNNGPVTLETRS